MHTITVETLRSWLDEGRPVSIVDAHPQAERQEWAIPGSRHIDAYATLMRNEALPDAVRFLQHSRKFLLAMFCCIIVTIMVVTSGGIKVNVI